MDGSLSQLDAITWFRLSQLQAVIRNGVVPQWFHGIISRKTAEELLMSKPPGYFLIRVSESRIGYSLSYRAEDRCRHFMIDALDGGYIILGENKHHHLLQDLVDYHCRIPIVPFTELLTMPCGQSSNDKTDYEELLFPKRNENQNTTLDSSSKNRDPVPPEDTPPALPYRPKDLIDSPAMAPNSQTSKLYPSLDNLHVLPAVPAPRRRYAANHSEPQATLPPKLPSRSVDPVPKLKQICPRTHCELPSPPRNNPDHPVTSVATNLKNFKKRFQQKRSLSQECAYEEIHLENEQKTKSTEFSENQQTVPADHFENSNMGMLQEYKSPPPFAPGYA